MRASMAGVLIRWTSPAEQRGVLAQEVVRELEDVLPALAQRRQVDGEALDPVEEVQTETSAVDLGLEIPVGRGDEADVRLARQVGTHALVLAFLKNAKQLHLQARRELADLVEEERPGLGLPRVVRSAAASRR